MSDTATRRVIIGVLLMLMVLPLLSYSEIDYSSEFGMRELFWFGRSSCKNVTTVGDRNEVVDTPDFYCTEEPWITEEGWHEMLRGYTKSSREDDASEVTKELLWLYIPSFMDQGRMTTIRDIPDESGNGTFWTETPNCSGFAVSSECGWRYEELELVTFVP